MLKNISFRKPLVPFQVLLHDINEKNRSHLVLITWLTNYFASCLTSLILLNYYIAIRTCQFSLLFSFFVYQLSIFVLSMQSILDLAVSLVLLLITLSIKDTYSTRNTGILGIIECTMWNNQFLLWALFVSSTWNIVTMTFER